MITSFDKESFTAFGTFHYYLRETPSGVSAVPVYRTVKTSYRDLPVKPWSTACSDSYIDHAHTSSSPSCTNCLFDPRGVGGLWWDWDHLCCDPSGVGGGGCLLNVVMIRTSPLIMCVCVWGWGVGDLYCKNLLFDPYGDGGGRWWWVLICVNFECMCV